MLYSTCTFDPGENERIIEHLKKEYPEFHVLPMEVMRDSVREYRK